MSSVKPGPAPKGGRRVTVRIPEDHADQLEAEARAAGYSRSDYVALLISQALDLPEPSYLQVDRDQGELPIGA